MTNYYDPMDHVHSFTRDRSSKITTSKRLPTEVVRANERKEVWDEFVFESQIILETEIEIKGTLVMSEIENEKDDLEMEEMDFGKDYYSRICTKITTIKGQIKKLKETSVTGNYGDFLECVALDKKLKEKLDYAIDYKMKNVRCVITPNEDERDFLYVKSKDVWVRLPPSLKSTVGED